MADYVITTDKSGEGLSILVSATIMSGDDAAINAALPMSKPGDLIYTSGYATIKQKGLDGSWTTL